jgi:hypothetical protein
MFLERSDPSRWNTVRRWAHHGPTENREHRPGGGGVPSRTALLLLLSIFPAAEGYAEWDVV